MQVCMQIYSLHYVHSSGPSQDGNESKDKLAVNYANMDSTISDARQCQSSSMNNENEEAPVKDQTPNHIVYRKVIIFQ